jgi:TolB-like protein
MVTGHVPFSGETPTETISLILQKEPAPLTRYVSDVPPELERIVTKALTKKRDERYQTAKDLLIDLRNLKRRIEVDAEIDRTVPPELRGTTATVSGSPAVVTAGGALRRGTGNTEPAASSAEYIFEGVKKHKLIAVFGTLVLIAVIGTTAWYLRGRNGQGAIESVAVLPFENQNGDTESEYMSDGLTDSIINSLTQLPNLKVIARSSVFRYKGKPSDPLTVAKELGVRAVLTGRILQRGDNLTISTELIDASDNKQLWGEQYERKISDLLSVQREIAQEITSNLRLKLSNAEQGQIAKHYTENPEAYQLFLKGRFYWNKRTKDGLQKSIEYFNQAIERDPNFALAYAGLADSWSTLAWYRHVTGREGYSKGKAAAIKSLELDPKLAEAHAILALIKANYDWDWAGAENSFKLALELNPQYATAHHRYSLFLPMVGRVDEAVVEAKKAQELDPLSLIINENVGDMLHLARRYDDAEKQLLKTIEMDPSFFVAHRTLARVYESKGMHEKALEEDLTGAPPEELDRAKKIYARSGMKGIWRDNLEWLIGEAKKGNVRTFSIAGIYARLGEIDKAFEWLDRALEERAIQFTYLIADPRWDNIRSDPRYTALLQRVGLRK